MNKKEAWPHCGVADVSCNRGKKRGGVPLIPKGRGEMKLKGDPRSSAGIA